MLAWPDVLGQFLRANHGGAGPTFEIGEQRFLMKYLQPGMNMLDVGAHDGLYSLLAARRIGSGKIWAFEPSARERQRLKLNLFLNGSSIDIIPKAVGEKPGTAKFYICQGEQTGCNSLRPPTVDDPLQVLEVEITTIDTVLAEKKIDRIDFVKMDIEGAELDALKGGSRLLRELRPVFMIEMEDVRTEAWGMKCQAVYDYLLAAGYVWFAIDEQGALSPAVPKEYYAENLVAVPREKAEQVAGKR